MVFSASIHAFTNCGHLLRFSSTLDLLKLVYEAIESGILY